MLSKCGPSPRGDPQLLHLQGPQDALSQPLELELLELAALGVGFSLWFLSILPGRFSNEPKYQQAPFKSPAATCLLITLYFLP